MIDKELEQRLARIEDTLAQRKNFVAMAVFDKDILKSISALRDGYPELTINCCGWMTESVLKRVWTQEKITGNPSDKTLEPLLQGLRDRIANRLIRDYMKDIQGARNRAAHGETVLEEDAVEVLRKLSYILNWYLDKYENGPIKVDHELPYQSNEKSEQSANLTPPSCQDPSAPREPAHSSAPGISSFAGDIETAGNENRSVANDGPPSESAKISTSHPGPQVEGAAVKEGAERRRALARPEDIHGWSADQVQALQAATAQALGLPVAFQHRLRDGGEGPELLVIPAGRFLMGSPIGEAGRSDEEGPQHQVTFAQPFAIGRYAVTFAEYDTFCAAIGCERLEDAGPGRGQHPVINVSWDDAVAYCAWLSEQTGHPYRLPSEAEWEYAARGGTTTAYWWGDRIDPSLANYNGSHADGDDLENEYLRTWPPHDSLTVEGRVIYWGHPLPVETFQTNPFGLYQVHGNIWEWCQDNWHGSYADAPTDGSVWDASGDSFRILRGGSWIDSPLDCRAASRCAGPADARRRRCGFRVYCVLGQTSGVTELSRTPT